MSVPKVFVYPIGVPLMFAVMLIKHWRALRDESRGAGRELLRDSNRNLDSIAVLFDVYKPKKWWWEVSPKSRRRCGLEGSIFKPPTTNSQCYDSLRRVLTTGVLVLFDPGSIP